MPPLAARPSTIERSAGASACGSSSAPARPGTMRAPDQYVLAAASTTANTAIAATRKPPANQPIAPGTAAEQSRKSHAFSRLPATARRTRRRSGVVFALVLDEPARRPVGLGRVAAAGAVQRGDVLERDEDVPVELYVRDVVDGAVRGQHAVLVVAAEERDLDLLALVLAGVVLHEPAQSTRRIVPFSTAIRDNSQLPMRPKLCRPSG